jgi:uncharacterized protein (TIRG00374 family)
MRQGKGRGTLIISIILTLVLVGFLAMQIRFDKAGAALADLSLGWLILAFLAYILAYLFRSIRWKVLLGGSHSMLRLYAITSIHNLFLNVLPVRSGELTYLYYLKQYTGTAYGKGLSSLVVARLFDFLSLVVFLVLSLVFVQEIILSRSSLAFFSAIVFIVLALALRHLSTLMNLGSRLARALARRGAWKRFSERTADILEGQAASLDEMSGNRTYGLCVVMTIITRIFLYLTIYGFVRAFGLELGIWAVVFGGSVSALTTVLPVQGIGGFGTFETGWTVAFILMGVTTETAIVSGFAFHIVLLMFMLVLAAFGFLVVHGMRKVSRQGQA